MALSWFWSREARSKVSHEKRMGVKGGVNMKGSDTFKKIPKNFWIVGIAIVGGYMLYRNIHRN